ncbi:hypothetical protein V6N12_035828 [Hibiscus sabdariffa]|uniref:Reverse transcriptase zinc-binding domain-containing protein n=1 Tax=Hibiscus sabdariffa TaxID=183260 RepID=A0ABR2ERC8_9ROSI
MKLQRVILTHVIRHIVAMTPPGMGFSTDAPVFLWLARGQKLLTNLERTRQHLGSSSLCLICNMGEESMEHVLHSCPIAKNIWSQLICAWNWLEFMSMPFESWLIANLRGRGDFVENDDLLRKACRLAMEFEASNVVCKARRSREPHNGTLNNEAVAGGVLRDDQGAWRWGFTRNLEESNNAKVVRLLNYCRPSPTNASLVDELLELISRDWEVKITHIGLTQLALKQHEVAQSSIGEYVDA